MRGKGVKIMKTTLNRILGINTRDSFINIDGLREKSPDVYMLIKESISEKKKQYDLLKKLLLKSDKDEFYRLYLEMSKTLSEYIYFIKNDTTGLIKIGMTKNPHDRISAINTLLRTAIGTESKLRYIGIIYMTSSKMKDYEKSLHDKYSLFRKHGEWFEIAEEEIINYYFCNSYSVNGVRFNIEDDSRILSSKYISENIPDEFWQTLIIHEIMKKCNYPYQPFDIENECVKMLSYFKISDIADLITQDMHKKYINRILEKANKDI